MQLKDRLFYNKPGVILESMEQFTKDEAKRLISEPFHPECHQEANLRKYEFYKTLVESSSDNFVAADMGPLYTAERILRDLDLEINSRQPIKKVFERLTNGAIDVLDLFSPKMWSYFSIRKNLKAISLNAGVTQNINQLSGCIVGSGFCRPNFYNEIALRKHIKQNSAEFQIPFIDPNFPQTNFTLHFTIKPGQSAYSFDRFDAGMKSDIPGSATHQNNLKLTFPVNHNSTITATKASALVNKAAKFSSPGRTEKDANFLKTAKIIEKALHYSRSSSRSTKHHNRL